MAGRPLQVAREHHGAIDILLCDVAMPERSGPEVATDIRGVRPLIRVLFVSGYPAGGESAVAAAGFLQKPFTRAALAGQLAALMSRPAPIATADGAALELPSGSQPPRGPTRPLA